MGDKRISRLNIGTFHSIALHILAQNPERTDYKLLSDTESRGLIEEILRQNRIPMTAREAAADHLPGEK